MIETVKHIKVRDVFNHSIHADSSEPKKEKNRMVTCKSIIDMLIMLSWTTPQQDAMLPQKVYSNHGYMAAN